MTDTATAHLVDLEPLGKVEMDVSYRNNTAESGLGSSEGSVQSISSDWTCHEGEITDPERFDPPVVSSNVVTFMSCDISTISDGSKAVKGNLSYGHTNKK